MIEPTKQTTVNNSASEPLHVRYVPPPPKPKDPAPLIIFMLWITIIIISILSEVRQ